MTDTISILAKERKLAALAAPESGASEGERANAQRMLDALLERANITTETLSQDTTQRRKLIVHTQRRGDVPSLNKALRQLAVQLFWYVVGDSKRPVFWGTQDWEILTRGLKAPKSKRVYVVVADCTELEHEDWTACFHHYAPAYLASEKEIKESIAAMQAALRKMLGVFVNKHGILPPDAPQSKREPTFAEMMAAYLASQNIKGEKWQRPAGRLGQPDFMLQ